MRTWDQHGRHFLFHRSPEERDGILGVLQDAIGAKPHIGFAYVHGSFVAQRPFHDIDIGVYLLWDPVQRSDWPALALLAGELEQACRKAPQPSSDGAANMDSRTADRERTIPVDVRVLNDAPLAFCYHALRGHLLFSRNEAVRVPWAAQIVSRYLDIRPLRHAALKEAIRSWA